MALFDALFIFKEHLIIAHFGDFVNGLVWLKLAKKKKPTKGDELNI